MKPSTPEFRTMRDSLARLAFQYMRRGDPRPYRSMLEAWAAPESEPDVKFAYNMADEIEACLRLWGDRAADGKVSTALGLKMPVMPALATSIK